MSITEHDPLDTTQDTVDPVGEGSSVLDHLHRRRDELARDEINEMKLEVPGWRGALRVVYRYPEIGAEPVIKAAATAQATGDAGKVLDANCDLLIACCHDIEGRVPDGDWQRLDTTDDRPLRFSKRLAELLQIDVPASGSPARFVLRNVFSPKAAATGVYEGDVALMAQGGQIAMWLQGGLQSSLGRVEGE